MNRKEVNEIKSQYTLEECGILRLSGCYVNGENEKVAQFNQTFLNLPNEEKHKYFDILKKVLSGKAAWSYPSVLLQRRDKNNVRQIDCR